MKAYYDVVVKSVSDIFSFTSDSIINSETRLEADLGMDSGLMLELIMLLEERIPGFHVDQSTISYSEFETISTVCDYILKHTNIANTSDV